MCSKFLNLSERIFLKRTSHFSLVIITISSIISDEGTTESRNEISMCHNDHNINNCLWIYKLCKFLIYMDVLNFKVAIVDKFKVYWKYNIYSGPTTWQWLFCAAYVTGS